MNKVRVQFLKERLKMVKRYEENTTVQDLLDIDGPYPLKGLKVLDVGCGGGLFTEVRRLLLNATLYIGYRHCFIDVRTHRDSLV